MIFFVAPQAGRFAQRYGSRWPMTVGPLLAGTGLFLLSRVGVDTDYRLMIPVLMMMGIGMGMTMAPMTAAVMNAVGPQRAGLGSATTNTSRELGGTFGIALLGTLLTTQLKDSIVPAIARLRLDPAHTAAIIGSAAHGRLDPGALVGLSPAQAAAVQQAFASSFLDGFRLALIVASAFVILAGIIANRFIPSGRPGARRRAPLGRSRARRTRQRGLRVPRRAARRDPSS